MTTIRLNVCEGTLEGKVTKTPNGKKYFEFNGIPYAEPPVGDLRFKPPVPAKPWEGVRDATKAGSICCQFNPIANKVDGNEDSLYLNVFTPEINTETKLPVMVFIHGGGFYAGNGGSAEFGPGYALEHNIVLVTLNYRLGILGYLHLEIPEAAGNMGMKDQSLAMKWVKENISSFGGDSDNITIFGASAGGCSVHLHVLSSLSKGLFSKVIAQSGSALNPWAIRDTKTYAYRVGERLTGHKFDDDSKLFEVLKAADSHALITASVDLLKPEEVRMFTPLNFSLTVEKRFEGVPCFLDEEPIEIIKNGNFNKVPIIFGCTSNESIISIGHPKSITKRTLESNTLIERFPWKFDRKEETEIENKLNTFYKRFNEHEDDWALKYFDDFDFIGGIWLSAELHSKLAPVYFYYFSFDGALNMTKILCNIDRKGAAHGDEIGYFFELRNLSPKQLEKIDNRSENIRKTVLNLWTNFAKDGIPKLSEEESTETFKWPKWTTDDQVYLEIEEKLELKRGLNPERIEFYINLFKKYGSKLR